MKKLLLIFFFSGSLDGFSQVDSLRKTSGTKVPDSMWHTITRSPLPYPYMTLEMYPHYTEPGGYSKIIDKPVRDTVRAICLVTLGYRNLNVAHARMGFVVVEEGKRPVYLDCRKQPLKMPQVGWGYVEVGGDGK